MPEPVIRCAECRKNIGVLRKCCHRYLCEWCHLDCPVKQEEREAARTEEITKGDLVKVLASGEFKGQQCQVLYIEHNTTRRRKYSDTWYLLDTRMAPHNWSKPAWFERQEIERVEMESEAQGC